MSDDAIRSGRGPEEPSGQDGITVSPFDQIDETDAERLLDGMPVPDATLAHGNVADLLAAAAGPPRPDELAGEASALAAFRAAVAGARPGVAAATTAANTETALPPASAVRRPSTARASAASRARPRRGRAASLVRTPAAIVALLLLIGGLCATAAAAVLTVAVDRPDRSVAGTGHPPTPDGSTGAVPDGMRDPSTATDETVPHPTSTASSSASPSSSSRSGGGPAADRHKLCTAWLMSRKPNHGKAFELLAEAAGGAGRVDEYCDGVDPLAEPPGAEGSGKGSGQRGEAEQPPAEDPGNGSAGASESGAPPSRSTSPAQERGSGLPKRSQGSDQTGSLPHEPGPTAVGVAGSAGYGAVRG